ncbi:MAG TPA: hypothetical protein PLK91_00635 [Sphaerochaeta sp.]|jgi:hypothetical protein|nr:hypothetical protein [Sphaerochaeta sp.]HOQ93681.1 hypothetical protein [Sphaerochaeta sp.]HPK47523.1 hypothetical protein [Sphaerochaeta sp.]
MMQTYLLSLLYLLYGSAFLLADVHGVRFPTLLSLRYQFRMKKGVRLILIILGLAIAALLAFFPMEPGPVLLGDFIPLLNVLSLAVYYLYLSLKGQEEEGGERESDSVLHATGQYVEHNRRNVGYLTLGVCIIHFLIPHFVLL